MQSGSSFVRCFNSSQTNWLKTVKKTTFYLWLAFSPVVLYGQEKVVVLLVGTQHEFTDSLKHLQQFEQIRRRLVRFAPDIICIESVPTSDAASLKEVRSDQLMVAGRLRDEKGILGFKLQEKIDELKNQFEGTSGRFSKRSPGWRTISMLIMISGMLITIITDFTQPWSPETYPMRSRCVKPLPWIPFMSGSPKSSKMGSTTI